MKRFLAIASICFAALVAGYAQASAGNIAFGDSHTYGVASSTPANAWVSKVSAALGIPITNSGGSGDMAPNVALRVYSVTPAAGDIYFLQVGANDTRAYGADVAKRSIYDLEIGAELAWLAIPAKQLPASCTKSGTWLPTIVWSGINSVHVGDYVECTVSGTTAFIWMMQQDNTDAGFQITVDGVVKDTGNTKSAGLGPTFNAQSGFGPMYWGPMLRQIDGVAAGSHVVRVTITSVGLNGKVYVDAMAGNSQAANLPKVYALNIFRCQVYSAGVDDSVIAAYNALIAARIASLNGVGLSVFPVDVASVVNPLTDEDGGCHAVDSGHANEAVAVIAAVTGPAPPPPPPPTYRPALIEIDTSGNYFGRDAADSTGITRKQLN